MSWTAEHPPARTLTCTCQQTLGGDHLTDLLVDLFRSVHRGPGHTITDTQPTPEENQQ